MPLARSALYADGTDLHVSVWPGWSSLTADITRFIAMEGRIWSMAVSGLPKLADIPSDFPLRDALYEDVDELPFDGGSGIVRPDGTWAAGPVIGEEALVIADVDREALNAERLGIDTSGHYSRPDVFSFNVDRTRHEPAHFTD
jgi:nitrilase